MWRAAAAPSIGLVMHRSKFYAGLVADGERNVAAAKRRSGGMPGLPKCN
jgi:hypothetical protein